MPLEAVFAQEERERSGRWFALPEEVGGEFFGHFIGSVGQAYRRRLDKLTETKRKQLGLLAKKKNGLYKTDLPQDEFGDCLARAMAGCTVTKIRGVIYQGAELPSTPENLQLVLSSAIVREHCNELLHGRENFAEAEPEYPAESVEGAEGNSAGASIGTSAMAVSATTSAD